MSNRSGWVLAALVVVTVGCSDDDAPGPTDADSVDDAGRAEDAVADAGGFDAAVAQDDACVGAAMAS